MYSRDRHPLLSDDLLQIKRPLEREAKNERPAEPDVETDEAIDAVGSLYVAHISVFFSQYNNIKLCP